MSEAWLIQCLDCPGLVLDVCQSDTTPESDVIVAPMTGSPTQQWRIDTDAKVITSAHTDMFLGVKRQGRAKSNHRVIVAPNPVRQWSVNASTNLIALIPNDLVLTISGPPRPDARCVASHADPRCPQRWRLIGCALLSASEEPNVQFTPELPLFTLQFGELAPPVQAGLRASTWLPLLPIQTQIIKFILTQSPQSLVVEVDSGSGKTVGFIVSILHRLLTKSEKILYVVPSEVHLAETLSLIDQLNVEAKIRVGPTRDCELVVTTPTELDFSGVNLAVFDEVTPLFLIQSLGSLPAGLQFCFSSDWFSPDAIAIIRSVRETTAKLSRKESSRGTFNCYLPLHHYHQVVPSPRGVLELSVGQNIIFTNDSKHGTEIAQQLPSAAFAESPGALARFRRGDIRILVATDVLTPGLHIPPISLIIGVGCPSLEQYLERSKRTCRFGGMGNFLNCVTAPDLDRLRSIATELQMPLYRLSQYKDLAPRMVKPTRPDTPKRLKVFRFEANSDAPFRALVFADCHAGQNLPAVEASEQVVCHLGHVIEAEKPTVIFSLGDVVHYESA
jgi:ATP-dependent RNA helicase DDX19/DBP5